MERGAAEMQEAVAKHDLGAVAVWEVGVRSGWGGAEMKEAVVVNGSGPREMEEG